MKTIHFQMQ